MKIILLTLLILVVFKIEATNYTLKISTITNDSILIENFNTQNQPTEPEIVDPIYHESRVHDVMTQLSNSLYWSEDYPDALGALTNGIPSYSQLNCVNFFADGSFMEVNINKSCKISFYTINIFYQDGIILKNQSNQTLFTYNFVRRLRS